MALLTAGSSAYFQTPFPTSPGQYVLSSCSDPAGPVGAGEATDTGCDSRQDTTIVYCASSCAEPECALSQNMVQRETTEQPDQSEQTTREEGKSDTAGEEDVSPQPDSSEKQGEECNGRSGGEEGKTEESGLPPRNSYVDRVWEDFVTDFLVGSCHIQQAAIFDLVSRRPLAASGDLHISPEEMEQLVACLNHVRLAYRNGVTLGGKAYKVRLADGRNGIMARTDSDGCTVCQTHTLVIVGMHDSRGNSRKCNEDVMRLGDFFRKKAL